MDTWLQQVFDALPDHIAILDANGRIIAVNQSWQRFARDNGAKSAEAFVGTNYLKVCRVTMGVDAPLARACLQGLEHLLAGKKSDFSLEYPCHSPTTQRWFLLKARRLEQGVAVIHTDITQLERKRQDILKLHAVLLETTKELLTQEVTPEFYQRLLERAGTLIPGAQAGSVTVRGEDNRFHFVAAVGFDLVWLSKVSFAESELHYANQGLSASKSFLVYGVDTINLKTLDAKRLRQLRKAGHTQRIKVTLGVPIFIADQVSATLSFDNFEDEHAFDEDARQIAEALGTQVGLILQLLRDKELLKKSEALFATLFHQNPTPALLSSIPDFRIIDANRSFLELVGYEAEGVIGKEVLKLPFVIDPRSRAGAERLSRGEAIPPEEILLGTKSGTVHTVLRNAAPIVVNGQRCALVTLMDISERKRTEEQLAQAIQEVMQDAQWFSHSVMEKLAQMRPQRVESAEATELTERELQVLALIAKGKDNTEIGKELDISPQTVRNYVSQIYSKLRIRSRAEAVVWARERGIIT